MVSDAASSKAVVLMLINCLLFLQFSFGHCFFVVRFSLPSC